MTNINEVNGNKILHTIINGDNLTKIAKANNTTIDAILKLNPSIKDPNLIYAGKTLVLSNNKQFPQKEDYSQQNMNLGEIKINGNVLSKINNKEIKSNFFANNLGDLAAETANDTNSASKIVIEMQAGKSMSRKDNDTPYSILNKTIGDHINNESTIIKDENNKFKIQNEWLENTDLYKAFISEDVNGDNFTGENNKLLSRGECGNFVQIPSVEVDKNGQKYFTLHGTNEILYFDEKGKKIEFNDGKIQTQSESEEIQQPILTKNLQHITNNSSDEFYVRKDNSDKSLNLGKYYINGEPFDNENLKSNYYTNNINTFMNETLNDNTKSSRLDLQLNIGSQINQRDVKADDILKKMLGTNYNKTSTIEKNSEQYQIKSKSISETDLYKFFISEKVNGQNFKENKLTRNENGFNLVQFPALETDENGVKYYTLHTNDNQILYFDAKGTLIK